MVQTLTKPVTFDEFIQWYPETGLRYELHNGVIIEMNPPLGDHELVIGWLVRKLSAQLDKLNPVYSLINEEYEVNQFRGDDQIISPLFPDLNLTIAQILQII
jgi:Uma2 family endonuclease